MKYFIALTLIHFALDSFGQFSIGFKAGLNINDFAIKDIPEGLKDDSNFGTGFHAGVYGKLEISERFWFTPEVQLSKRGAKDDAGVRIDLTYFALPLLASYSPVEWLTADLGPSIAYKISARAKGNGLSTNINHIYKKNLDVGLTGGLRISLPGNFHLYGRYYFGLTPVLDMHYRDQFNNPLPISKVYNRTIEIGASYELR